MRAAGLILAGGRGSRMGEGPPKPLRVLGHEPLVARVAAPLRQLCDPVFINAGEDDDYRFLGLPTIADLRSGFQGPLAGIEAGLRHLARIDGAPDRLLVVPGDTPFLGHAGLERLLLDADDPCKVRVARFRDRLQPTVALWPVACLPSLSRWLDSGGPRAVRAVLEALNYRPVDFCAVRGLPDENPFFNVNTPEDLAAASASESVL